MKKLHVLFLMIGRKYVKEKFDSHNFNILYNSIYKNNISFFGIEIGIKKEKEKIKKCLIIIS